jgi:uncharacterized protein YjiS (DUF1127 family)
MALSAAKSSFLSRVFLHPLKRLSAAHRDRRRMNELLQLSDSLLRDIGITRFDVHSAVRSSGIGIPSAVLAEAAKARIAANADPVSERFELKAA